MSLRMWSETKKSIQGCCQSYLHPAMVGSRHLGPGILGNPGDPKWGETDIEPSPNPSKSYHILKIWSICVNILSTGWLHHIAPTDMWGGTWALICRLLYDWKENRWRNLIEVRVVAVPLSSHHFGWSRPELVIIHPQQWMFQCPIGFSI